MTQTTLRSLYARDSNVCSKTVKRDFTNTSRCYVTRIMPILLTYFSDSFKADPGICPCFAWSMIITPIYHYKECLTLMCQVLVQLYGKQYPFNI